MASGQLIILPTPLHDDDPFIWNSETQKLIHNTKIFITENEKQARRHLKRINKNMQDMEIRIMNQNTSPEQYYSYLNECKTGSDIILMSDCGCPGIADPGAEVVAMAHALLIPVKPIVGPSSITLMLMASGLNGQRFMFHGYLPIPIAERNKKIKELESKSRIDNCTQLFIETPYRNTQLMNALTKVCREDTRLCVASNINTPEQFIYTKTIADWRRKKIDIHRKPTIFAILL